MKVSLFLGAGASVPFDMPTTERFRGLMHEEPKIQKDDIMLQLLNAPGFKDIEHVLRAIEDIEDIKGEYGKSFLASFNLTPQSFPNTFLQELDSCKETIIKYVYQYYSFDTEKIQKVKEHYDSIFKGLHLEKKIHVFTTNYDQIVEEYVRNTKGLFPNDGFKHDEKTQKNIFDSKNFDANRDDDGRTTVNIYKLHGSLNWKKVNGQIMRQDTENQSQNKSENILIYPTLDPKNGLDEEPYKTISSKFKTHIKNTDVFVVVGYSFRDAPINDIFKKFVELGKKLIVISPTVSTDINDVDFISGNNSNSVNTLSPSTYNSARIRSVHFTCSKLKQISDEIKNLNEQKMQNRNNTNNGSAKENTSETSNQSTQPQEELSDMEKKLRHMHNEHNKEITNLRQSLNLDSSKNICTISGKIEESAFIIEAILHE